MRRKSHAPRVEGLEGRSLLTTLMVTSNADFGPGTLRQALLDASGVAASTAVTIDFAIGSGRQTISPNFALPFIMHDNVTIDGTSQPGFNPSDPRPLIVLDGSNIVQPAAGGIVASQVDGLDLLASGGVVRGLVIDRFPGAGIRIGGTGKGNLVAGDYIGIDPTGAYAQGNYGPGVVIDGSTADTVGGTAPADRNVISGNGPTYIIFSTAVVAYPGTPITGPPSQADGITVLNSSGDFVFGNLIGTDATGTYIVGNGRNGVTVVDSPGTVIGGLSTAYRNVISGNGEVGVVVIGHNLPASAMIQGNLVGTDLTGTRALGNGYGGIALNGSSDSLIGGPGPVGGNVVSGNGGNGIQVIGYAERPSTGVVIRANLVGVDVSGVRPLGNANCGIVVASASGVTIGGTTPGAGNIVGDSKSGPGVVILGNSQGLADHQTIQGNHIGIDASGRFPLGNAFDGLVLASSSSDTVGGTAAGAANVIADNRGRGVWVRSRDNFSTGDSILSNRIYGNDGAPIVVGIFGDAPFLPNGHQTGSNNLEPAPILGTIDRVSTSDLETLHGTLDSKPNTTFTIQVFADSPLLVIPFGSRVIPGPLSNPPAGARAGLSTLAVTTDAKGHADFQIPIPKTVTSPDAYGTVLDAFDRFLLATATDAAGNTSALSPPIIEFISPPTPVFTINRAAGP